VKILIRFTQELNCIPVALKKQQLDYYVKYTRLPSLHITRAFGREIEKVKRGVSLLTVIDLLCEYGISQWQCMTYAST